MLVLSRRKDERIQISNDISITVLEIRGDAVKLGLTAPKDVPIFRSELLKRTTNTIPGCHFNGDEPHE